MLWRAPPSPRPLLRELNASDNALGDAALISLAASLRRTPLLKSLKLDSNRAAGKAGVSAVAAQLAHVPGLSSLGLSATGAEDWAAIALAAELHHTPHLSTLGLQDTDVSDYGFEKLARAAGAAHLMLFLEV